MSLKSTINNMLNNYNGVRKTAQHAVWSKYPFAVPRMMIPRVIPYLINRERLSVIEAYRIYQQVSGPDRLKQHKDADVLCILGSGSSINELCDPELNFIAKQDSMALNWWGVYHDFIPDFYKFEFTDSNYLNKKWMDEINKRGEAYENTVFIFEPERPFGAGQNMSELIDALANPVIRDLVEIRIFSYYVQTDAELNPKVLSSLFPTVLGGRFLHYRGSLSQAIAMGAYMEYDDIILFGVDLNDSEYFFSDHPDSHKQTDQGRDPDERHATAEQKQFHGIDEYIRVLNGDILPNRGIQLHIGSKQSLLSPELPYYKNTFDV